MLSLSVAFLNIAQEVDSPLLFTCLWHLLLKSRIWWQSALYHSNQKSWVVIIEHCHGGDDYHTDDDGIGIATNVGLLMSAAELKSSRPPCSLSAAHHCDRQLPFPLIPSILIPTFNSHPYFQFPSYLLSILIPTFITINLIPTFNSHPTALSILISTFITITLIPSLIKIPLLPTPSHKQLIPGSERPFLETNFFLRFSVRLSGNNRSRVISMGDFSPTASNFCYDFWQIFFSQAYSPRTKTPLELDWIWLDHHFGG